MKKKILIPAAILIIVSVILLWIFWGNTALIIHKITITSDRLTDTGVRIDEASVMDSVLSKMMKDVNGYSILLSHRPELFEVYASRDLDQ